MKSVLTIAGSDSGGGAGIQADLKTFGALGLHGVSIITALTAQNTLGVRSIHVPPLEEIESQFEAIFEDFDVEWGKTGMLPNKDVIELVVEMQEKYGISLVVDPVIYAESGAKLIESAKSVSLPQDAQIIDHAIHDFIVDGASGIEDPIGMSASKLEGDILLFITQTPAIGNLLKALGDANITPTDIIVSPIASANSVLTDEERELGVILIDIGAGNTDAVVYRRNRPQTVVSVPYAGESVTHDLMVGLKLTKRAAEELKQKNGCALKDGLDEDTDVKIMGIGGREPRIVKKSFIAMIMEARLEEILSMIVEQLNKNGVELNGENFPAGVVLTGGTTLTPKLVFLAEKVLKLPVRIGLPGDRSPVPDGMNTPDYHIAWGALQIASRRHKLAEMLESDSGKLPAFWNKIKKWILQKL